MVGLEALYLIKMMSKDVGLGARARSRSSLCETSSVSLVDLVLHVVQGCMLLLKNYEYI